MISNIRAVSRLIRQAEGILLTGGQHLNGRGYQVEEDAKEKKDASIAIVQAYSVLKELGGSHPCYLRRIGYLARDIMNFLYPEEAPWHVDHVIPLAGEYVCGLHHHDNMQLLPGSVNLRKHNGFDI